ncbi:MAG TPA: hypothetical protein VJM50_21950 [Pyrinomonadaceae bacterium]|nr:hypothetical protein [Pyrinomonadaceae bacterium]
MSDWHSELNAIIETGTRVGVAYGDIWPLNIGQTGIEISLLGDTINRAARLEKACEVNGILLDNRTRTKAGKIDATYIQSLRLVKRELTPSHAKGQQFDTLTGQVPPTHILASEARNQD